MRNFNYIPILKGGFIAFVHIQDIEQTDLMFACREKDILFGPEYFYNQFKEKYA